MLQNVFEIAGRFAIDCDDHVSCCRCSPGILFVPSTHETNLLPGVFIVTFHARSELSGVSIGDTLVLARSYLCRALFASCLAGSLAGCRQQASTLKQPAGRTQLVISRAVWLAH